MVRNGRWETWRRNTVALAGLYSGIIIIKCVHRCIGGMTDCQK